MRALDHVGGRRAQGVREQLDRVAHRYIDERPAHRVRPAEQALHARRILRERRHAVPLEQLFQESPVFLGDQLLEIQLLETALLLADVGGGNHDVDAVGVSVDVLIDPLECALEFLGCEDQRAEHAHASCTAHGGHHVAAMAEGEDRILDSERFTNRGTHLSFFAACTSSLVLDPFPFFVRSLCQTLSDR